MHKIRWKGTPGVGDYMMGLNVAHHFAYTKMTPVHVEFNWYHDRHYRHHPEDPETIIERLSYSYDYYAHRDMVSYTNEFNSTDGKLYVDRYHGVDFKPTAENRVNYWCHDKSLFKSPQKDKVVIWRPLHNAEIAPKWKEVVDNYTWNKIIDILQYAHGYDVVELTYRTPIAKAYEEINSAEFVLCYDGMWHYVARNFLKPMLVTSANRVTRFHTPNALMLPNNQFAYEFILKLHEPTRDGSNYDKMIRANERYKKQLGQIIDAY